MDSTDILILLQTWLSNLITLKCYHSLLNVNLDIECSKIIIIKLLGIGIILGSILVKIPQIIKIIKSKSGKGLDIASYTLNMVCCAISLGYNYQKNFPLSAYGENISLLIQDFMIIFLVLYYSNGFSLSYVLTNMLFAGFIGSMLNGYIPEYYMDILKIVSIPLFSLSRVLQIRTFYINQSTGQLSVITQFLQFAGSSARVLTTLSETKDILELSSFLLAALLNGILMAQIYLYRNNDMKDEKKVTKKRTSSKAH